MELLSRLRLRPLLYGALEVSYPRLSELKSAQDQRLRLITLSLYICIQFSTHFYFYSGRLYTILDLTRSSCEKFNNWPLLSRLYSGGNRTCMRVRLCCDHFQGLATWAFCLYCCLLHNIVYQNRSIIVRSKSREYKKYVLQKLNIR